MSPERTEPAPAEVPDGAALPLAEARRRLVAAVAPVDGIETLALMRAHGRTLAEDVSAAMDVPPFRASEMDGYAVRAAHAGVDATLAVTATSLAGHPSTAPVGAGECVRVTTGARVPDDCDAVLAAHGTASVRVRRRPRVGILSTGDELREPGEALPPGAVHDANRALLGGLLAGAGVEVVDLGIVADSPEAMASLLAAGDDIDAWVSSGGVSVGDADHVRDALEGDGEVVFWKVAMKPGRPLAFGRVRGRPWFGLPGNPVSAAVTALLLVRPALAVLCGRAAPMMPVGRGARVAGELLKVPGRLEFQRGRMTVNGSGELRVADAGLQESHGLRALQRANCLIELPADSTGAKDGERVIVHPFESFAEPPL